MTFTAHASIPGLPPEAHRAVTEQFKQVEAALVALDTPQRVITPLKTADYSAHIGELVPIIPPAAGLKFLLPAANAQNQNQSLQIAVRSAASGGVVTVTAVGGQSINGAATLALSTAGLTTFVSLGVVGWSAATGGGGGSGPSTGATGNATLNFGNAPGTNVVTVVVPDAGVVAGSNVQAWIQGNDSTATHNAVEHQMLPLGPLSLTAIAITAGVSFTLQAMTPLRLRGTFTARWARS